MLLLEHIKKEVRSQRAEIRWHYTSLRGAKRINEPNKRRRNCFVNLSDFLAMILSLTQLSAFCSDQSAHQHVGMSTHSLWDVLVKSDLLNVIILALAIIYLGNKFFPQIIEQRKKQISKELEEAKLARIKAADELKLIEEKYRGAEFETQEIKKEARKTADIIKSQIEQEAEKELEQLRLKIKREISSSQEEAIQNIKRSASEAAIKLAEEALSKVSKNMEVQKKLVENFLTELKAPSKN